MPSINTLAGIKKAARTIKVWRLTLSWQEDLNPQQPVYDTGALPIELCQQNDFISVSAFRKIRKGRRNFVRGSYGVRQFARYFQPSAGPGTWQIADLFMSNGVLSLLTCFFGLWTGPEPGKSQAGLFARLSQSTAQAFGATGSSSRPRTKKDCWSACSSSLFELAASYSPRTSPSKYHRR